MKFSSSKQHHKPHWLWNHLMTKFSQIATCGCKNSFGCVVKLVDIHHCDKILHWSFFHRCWYILDCFTG